MAVHNRSASPSFGLRKTVKGNILRIVIILQKFIMERDRFVRRSFVRCKDLHGFRVLFILASNDEFSYSSSTNILERFFAKFVHYWSHLVCRFDIKSPEVQSSHLIQLFSQFSVIYGEKILKLSVVIYLSWPIDFRKAVALIF